VWIDYSWVPARQFASSQLRRPARIYRYAVSRGLVAPSAGHVLLNRCGEPITRFGIHTTVERYAADTFPGREARRSACYSSAHDGMSSAKSRRGSEVASATTRIWNRRRYFGGHRPSVSKCFATHRGLKG